MLLCICHTVWSKLGEITTKGAKSEWNRLNSDNFGSDSYSIGVVVIWNALFRPWLRLIVFDSKPLDFCSWAWKGLWTPRAVRLCVECGTWAFHGVLCHPTPLIVRGTKAWNSSFQIHAPGFSLERWTDLVLVLKDLWALKQACFVLTMGPRVPLAPLGPVFPGWPESPAGPVSPGGPSCPFSPCRCYCIKNNKRLMLSFKNKFMLNQNV